MSRPANTNISFIEFKQKYKDKIAEQLSEQLNLTAREAELIMRITTDPAYSDQACADDWVVSKCTVKSHKISLGQKLKSLLETASMTAIAVSAMYAVDEVAFQLYRKLMLEYIAKIETQAKRRYKAQRVGTVQVKTGD